MKNKTTMNDKNQAEINTVLVAVAPLQNLSTDTKALDCASDESGLCVGATYETDESCRYYDVEYDGYCPKCGHSPLHSRSCTNWCDEGFKDEYDDDPINFMPGEELTECEDCKGTGIERWCPSCGENLSGVEIEWDEDNE